MTKVRLNRTLICETGIIPAGYQLFEDSMPFQILESKKVLKEWAGDDGKKTEEPVMVVTGLLQKGNYDNSNGRYYPTPILREAIRNLREDINARAVVGEYDHPRCLTSANFRVLTVDKGWQDFADVNVGDYVWSRIDGQMIKSRVNEKIDQPYDGQAYRVRGRHINTDFTPGHKFVILRRSGRKGGKRQMLVTLEDIHRNRTRYNHDAIPRTASWNGIVQETIIIPGLSTELAACHKSPEKTSQDLVIDTGKFVSFLGLYLAEGHPNRNGVVITQKTEHNIELISDLLQSMHPDLEWSRIGVGFRNNDPRLAYYLRALGDKYTKHIPEEIKQLDATYLEKLIYWFVVGDGRSLAADEEGRFVSTKTKAISKDGEVLTATLDHGVNSRMAVFSVSKRLIDDLHECVIKTGRCGKLSQIVPENDYVFADHVIKAENKSVLHQLHISRGQNVYLDKRFTEIEPFQHTGRIYCLSVDHGNFYMEQNGCSFWTGNSAKINLDRLSHVVTKLWMEKNDVFGEVEVLDNQPLGRCLRGLFERKIRTGISSRGVGDMELQETTGHKRYIVLEGYTIVTWDTVHNPSVKPAILSIKESVDRACNLTESAKTKGKKVIKDSRELALDKHTREMMLLDSLNHFLGIKDFGPRRTVR